MKTKPSVGDRVWYWSYIGTKIRGTVKQVGQTSNKDLIIIQTDKNGETVTHYKQLGGHVRKKPRKCGECAKPKQLFYIGHDGDINNHTSLHYPSKKVLNPHWKYISTLALISTEEVNE